MSKQPPRTRKGFWYAVIEFILRPFLMIITKRDWRGGQYLQVDGGMILAMNHLSWFDPFVAAHFANDNGRPARFLAKSEVFKIPVIGRMLKGAGQIPVQRGTTAAVSSLHAAIEAVNKGECVVIYPEGTLTRDPQLWPMSAKNGVARIALTTGAPVIPAAQWGPQEVLAPYSKKLHVFPRKTMRVWAGPEVDLSDLRAQPMTSTTLAEATSRIMRDVTLLLAQIRDETPPATPFERSLALKPQSNETEIELGPAAGDS